MGVGYDLRRMGKHSIVIPKVQHDIRPERHRQREPAVPEAVEVEGPVQPRQTRNELERHRLGGRIELQPGGVDGSRLHGVLGLGNGDDRES